MFKDTCQFSKSIEDGCCQLEKGKHFFKDVLAPLTGLPDTWTHHGFLCLPKIESRTVIEKECELEDINKVTSTRQSKISLQKDISVHYYY